MGDVWWNPLSWTADALGAYQPASDPANWSHYGLTPGTDDDTKTAAVLSEAAKELGVSTNDPTFKQAASQVDVHGKVGWGGSAPNQIIAALKSAYQTAPESDKSRAEAAANTPAAQAALPTLPSLANNYGYQQLVGQAGAIRKELQNNPYGTYDAHGVFQPGVATQAMFSGLAAQQAPQQHALSGILASRGMMGSGQELAMRTALQGQQGVQRENALSQAANESVGYTNALNNQLSSLYGGLMGTGQNYDFNNLSAAMGNNQFNTSAANTMAMNNAANAIGNYQFGVNSGFTQQQINQQPWNDLLGGINSAAQAGAQIGAAYAGK